MWVRGRESRQRRGGGDGGRRERGEEQKHLHLEFKLPELYDVTC